MHHGREWLSGGDALVFLVLLFSLMQNNIHSGWRHTSAFYRERIGKVRLEKKEGADRRGET